MPLPRPLSPVCRVAVAAALVWAAHGAATAQSVERGAALYAAHCSGCHSIDQHGDGPAHRGVVGRRAGALKDFDYSPALRASKILWTRATLKAWLSDPEALIPGQGMDYRLEDARDREDVVAYLATLKRLPVPEAATR
ncbi:MULTISPECIES: cytochrome c family protein [unclassified Acidovorax]|uniref:c-type cytochrome n=1 Tax=unclassified Acidovorax TaxID=2684926 RepID=UPI0006F3F7E3|nr:MULTISPECIES: c-type cytochrome [unclassified Acidovorax]KRB27585.1 cytochrome C [Acidovorax sp. Root70]PUA99420.1 cytochrome c [Acidovorax sp. 107]